MYRFENTEYLYALLLIPVFILIYWLSIKLKKRALNKFGDSEIIAYLMPEISKYRPIWKLSILMLAFASLVIGIANPQIGAKLEETNRSGIEIIIALDVSNSMMAEDIQPNRLERAKQAVSKLVDRLSNDKIGLIVFAGEAFIQLPITTDYASAKMFLSTISTKMIKTQGTSIGNAISLAAKSFTPESETNKAIIIITDGEDHEENAIEQAEAVAEKGIIVHTIGMGLPKGAPIPVIKKYGQRDFKTDKDGNIIVSKLNETVMQQIASAGNGTYIRANNTKVGLDALFNELEKIEKKKFEVESYSDYEDIFPYFIGLTLFLLLLEFIIMYKKNRLFKDVNIFNTKK